MLNIMKNPIFRGEGHKKPIYRGNFKKKGELGQFADLRGGGAAALGKKEGD